MGLPPYTIWHISHQQCKPPQICYQSSSKTLRRATSILVLHVNQVLQKTSLRAGLPSIAQLPDLSAEQYQKPEPKTFSNQATILESTIHTATTK